MSFCGKQWIWAEQDQQNVNMLAKALAIEPVLARLLINRDITDPEQAWAFLNPSTKQLHSPWLMLGMEQAVRRLGEALEKKEKIIVHGDYDADGITASVILVEALQRLGAFVDFYLPSRFEEGYGLHKEPLARFKEAGCSLVVTADCGINASEEIAYAGHIGLEIIVTDHHQPLEPLLGVVSVINPLQKECPYPFKELSGAGIAFKLASALFERAGVAFPTFLLDLAALGTAADVVPLLGENRVIVSAGLEVLRSLQRVGFKALAETVGLKEDHINSTALSFVLAPAINAAGRLGEAMPAAKLLLEKDIASAELLARDLHQSNKLRRSVELTILQEMEEIFLQNPVTTNDKVIVLAGERWHHGVIGIVASRLVERYNRPVIVIALEGVEGRGSARSIPGFDITTALSECAPLLKRFGGHGLAAGFTVAADRVNDLRAQLNVYASKHLVNLSFTSPLHLEANLDEADINQVLVDQLEKMQPFGAANPVPLFGSYSWKLNSWKLVGADKSHLKLNLHKNKHNLSPIFFSSALLEPKLEEGLCLDITFKLKNGTYRGQKTLEVELKDLQYCDSAVNGNLQLIDRRNHKNRFSYLQEILKKDSSDTVVFAATRARLEKIKACLHVEPPVYFLTTGSVSSFSDIPERCSKLFLFDLPLHEGLLEPVLRNNDPYQPITVHLLYGLEDQERNSLLIDLSFPSTQLLVVIYSLLVEAAGRGNATVFPGQVKEQLKIKPGKNFWHRCKGIFTEIGLLEGDQLAPDWVAQNDSWQNRLISSPVFCNSQELRKRCMKFQELLLYETPTEIARHLNNLPFL